MPNFRVNTVSMATAIALILSQVPAYAEPALMLGLSLNFGGGRSKVGVTSKVLSGNEPDQVVGAAGITYFFDDTGIAFDAGVGYTLDGGAITFTYDFTNGSPQVSVGSVDTKDPVIQTVC